MTYEEAIEYIKKVLNNWGEWKTHHLILVKALEVIIEHSNEGGSARELTEHTTRDTSS